MIGIGILGWLLMLLLGWPAATTITSSEADAEDSSPPMEITLGPVAAEFFASTPGSCGVAGEAATPRETREAWACLRDRADAGRAAQLMLTLDHSTVAYYRVTADRTLEVYTDRLDGGDMTVTACPAPADLSRGCS